MNRPRRNRVAIVRVSDRSSSCVTERIRAEYIEMPGLSLTVPQAARFWGVSTPELERLLTMLVESGFLVRDRSGSYRRSR